jgi:hypothetical protein
MMSVPGLVMVLLFLCRIEVLAVCIIIAGRNDSMIISVPQALYVYAF